MTAKLGSISKAAKELYTSQPAISQSIKQLEAKLEGQLFYRTPKGVTLTTEGKVLFAYIEQGYLMMETAQRKYQELKDLKEGQLKISACSEICKYILMDSVCAFNQKYPGIKIQIKDETSSEILSSLESGEIDLGIFSLYQQRQKNIEILRTLPLQDCFVVGKTYQKLCNKKMHIAELVENYPIILLQEGGNTRAYMDYYFKSMGLFVKPQLELSNMELMVKFAMHGFGAAYVSKDYVKKELAEKELFEVKLVEKIKPRQVVVAIKKGMPLSTATEEFLAIFHTYSKEKKGKE